MMQNQSLLVRKFHKIVAWTLGIAFIIVTIISHWTSGFLTASG